MNSAYAFFRKHGGSIVGENARCALSLAHAERDAALAGIIFVWEGDDYADWSFIEDWPAPARKAWDDSDHYAECCRAVIPCEHCKDAGWTHAEDCRHAETLASLCGIIDADSAYRRVIEAELAQEALSEISKTGLFHVREPSTL